MNVEQVVDSRPKGAFPISIGTSLAIEALLGVYPDKPVVTPAPLLSMKQVWFNLRTLIRNIVACVPTSDRPKITVEEVTAALREEVEILQGIISENSKGGVLASFYFSKYEHVNVGTFKGALLKVSSTPSQLAYDNIEKGVIAAISERRLEATVFEFKDRIVGRFDRSFILTHCPVDLLDRYRFLKLELIESHTGTIKAFPIWSSKLSVTEWSRIPFNDFTLKVFGDGVHFLGQRPTLKKAVLTVAEADSWTGLTTPDRIKNSLQKIANPDIRQQLLELL